MADEVTSKHYNKQLMKQECIVRDSNGSCRNVLWENEIERATGFIMCWCGNMRV